MMGQATPREQSMPDAAGRCDPSSWEPMPAGRRAAHFSTDASRDGWNVDNVEDWFDRSLGSVIKPLATPAMARPTATRTVALKLICNLIRRAASITGSVPIVREECVSFGIGHGTSMEESKARHLSAPR